MIAVTILAALAGMAVYAITDAASAVAPKIIATLNGERW